MIGLFAIFVLRYNGSSVRYEFGFFCYWYGYLIVAGILLLWLVGIVCGWRWTYSRPGSWEGNFWLGTLGERSYRFWLGLIVAAATGCALLLFFVTG